MSLLPDIKAALAYPFAKKRLVSMIFAPVMFNILAVLLLVGLTAAGFMAAGPVLGATLTKMQAASHNPMAMALLVPDLMTALKGPAGLILLGGLVAGFLAAFLCMCPIIGYQWTVIDNIQTDGINGPAPIWKECVDVHFKAGIHTILIMVVMFIPAVIFGTLSLGALVPFFIAPYFVAARDRTFAGYFISFKKGFGLVKGNLIPVVATFYAALALTLVLNVLSSLLSFTVLVPLMIAAAVPTIMNHMMAQQLGYRHSVARPVAKYSNYEPPKADGIGSSSLDPSDLHSETPALQSEDAPADHQSPIPESGDMVMFPNTSDATMDAGHETEPNNTAQISASAESDDSAPSQSPSDVKKLGKISQGDNPWVRHRQTG